MSFCPVILEPAGIQSGATILESWIPACAGMTT